MLLDARGPKFRITVSNVYEIRKISWPAGGILFRFYKQIEAKMDAFELYFPKNVF